MIKFFLNNKEYIVESELQVHAILQAEAKKGRPVPKKLDVTISAPSSSDIVVIAGGRFASVGGHNHFSWADMYKEVEAKEGDYWKLPKGKHVGDDK